MFNMIKSDIYRVFKGKAIYICIIFIFIFMILSTFELAPGWIGVNNSILDSDYGSNISDNDERAIYEANSIFKEREIMKKYPYKLDKAIIGANVNLYYIFIVIIVIVLATDFSNSTVKNTISSSVSRKKYYFSKLLICILICTLFIVLNNYGTYFINLLMNGRMFSSSLGVITKVTLYQLPLMYGIISLLVCISAATRKTSIFNAIAIPFLMISQLILMGIISLFKLSSNIISYEYQVALFNLASSNNSLYIMKCILTGIVYIIIFSFIGYYLFKKAELK